MRMRKRDALAGDREGKEWRRKEALEGKKKGKGRPREQRSGMRGWK